MPKIKIEGGHKLSGTIPISGAKNSVVALIPAAILCDETVTISNVPDITDVDDEYWTKNIPIKSKHTIPNPFSEIYEYYFSTYTFENNYVGIHLLIIDTITSTFDIYIKEDKYEPEKKEEKEEEKGTHINEFVMFLLGVVGMAVLIGIIWFFTKTEAGLCILGCCCATFCSSEGGGD